MKTMYTIKSKSKEGTFYLCNHWDENKTFWIKRKDIKQDKLFDTPVLAKISLRKLLTKVSDYWYDHFTLVEVCGGKITEISDVNVKITGRYDEPKVKIDYPRIRSKWNKNDYVFVDKRYDGKYEILYYDANASRVGDAYLIGKDYLFGDKPGKFESGIKAYKFMKDHINYLS